jgi:hypothetical protein
VNTPAVLGNRPGGGELHVRGGAGGVAARTEDLEHAARALRSAAGGLAEAAVDTAGVAAAPALLATGLLAPLTLARAEAALVAALAGPRGLVTAGLRLETLALRLRAAALGYGIAERSARSALGRLELAAGRLVVQGSVRLVPLAASTAVLPVPLGVAVVRGGLRTPMLLPFPVPPQWPRSGGSLLEPVVAALPAVVALPAGPLRYLKPSVPDLAGVLAVAGRAGPLLHESGRVAVTARPVPASPPRGVADLLTRVASCYADAGVPPGSVRVEGVSGADGRRAWVVEIPGTQEWSPLAGRNPDDLAAAVAALGRASTAAAATVVRALELAGARPSEPVLLAGHSLGGMIAAGLAADPRFTRRFRVTHVLAAGSPLAGYPVRPGVRVLALEHDDDLVPALDGAPDPDRPDWITVRRSPARGRSPAAAHNSMGYVETAALVDASPDASLRAWRAGLAPFLARPGAHATGLLVVGRRTR